MLSLCGTTSLLYGGEDQQGQQEDAGDDLDEPTGIIGGGVEDETDGMITRGDGEAAEGIIGSKDGNFVIVDEGIPAAVVVDFAEDGKARTT